MIECLQKVFETIIKVIIGAFFARGKRPSLTRTCETSANGSSTDESRALGKPLPACLKSSRERRNARPAAVKLFLGLLGSDPKTGPSWSSKSTRSSTTYGKNRDNAEFVFLNADVRDFIMKRGYRELV